MRLSAEVAAYSSSACRRASRSACSAARLGFLFGVGGLVTTVPEVYRQSRFMTCCETVWMDTAAGFCSRISLDGFFGGAGGWEHGSRRNRHSGVAVEGLFGVGDEVDDRWCRAPRGARRPIGDPLARSRSARFDVAEDVVEVRGAGRLREAFFCLSGWPSYRAMATSWPMVSWPKSSRDAS